MENFELMDRRSTRNAASLTAAVTAITWLFLPLSRIGGVASFGWGGRALGAHAGLELGLLLGLSFFGVFFFLVFPTAHFLFREGSERVTGGVRVALVTLLLSLPVLSFAHFLGTFEEPLDYVETSLFILVPIFTQALLFEKERSPLVFTIGLLAGLFPPLFLVNDLMGPFEVFVTYAPHDMTTYFMHRGLAVVALAYAAVRCAEVFRVSRPVTSRASD